MKGLGRVVMGQSGGIMVGMGRAVCNAFIASSYLEIRLYWKHLRPRCFTRYSPQPGSDSLSFGAADTKQQSWGKLEFIFQQEDRGVTVGAAGFKAAIKGWSWWCWHGTRMKACVVLYSWDHKRKGWVHLLWCV